jgi:hypothetical protein
MSLTPNRLRHLLADFSRSETKTMTTAHAQTTRRSRRRAGLVAAAVSAAVSCLPQSAIADELATGFQIEERPIQKVPTTFKFQSRISQAKMPVGNQTFTTIYVNLVRGTNDVQCSEQLNQVQVRDSVLNIEIGRGFNCQLDEIIAANSDLNFQICIQSKENCLKPVALSSVPYAVKATFSQQAQEAHTADIAAQCHYAHRVTADTGLLSVNNQSQYGVGYYDFATPVSPGALASLSMPTGVTNKGGFLQWTPVNPGATSDITVCKRAHNSSSLAKLDTFNVQAMASYFSNAAYVGSDATQTGEGYLEVDGNGHFVGNLDGQNGTIRANLNVGGVHTVTGTVATGGNAGSSIVATGHVLTSADLKAPTGAVRAINGEFTGNVNATSATGTVTATNVVGNTAVRGPVVTATTRFDGPLVATTRGQFDTMRVRTAATEGFEVTSTGQVIFYVAPQFPAGVVFPAAGHRHPWSQIDNIPTTFPTTWSQVTSRPVVVPVATLRMHYTGGLTCVVDSVKAIGRFNGTYSCSRNNTASVGSPYLVIFPTILDLDDQIVVSSSSDTVFALSAHRTSMVGMGAPDNAVYIYFQNRSDGQAAAATGQFFQLTVLGQP